MLGFNVPLPIGNDNAVVDGGSNCLAWTKTNAAKSSLYDARMNCCRFQKNTVSHVNNISFGKRGCIVQTYGPIPATRPRLDQMPGRSACPTVFSTSSLALDRPSSPPKVPGGPRHRAKLDARLVRRSVSRTRYPAMLRHAKLRQSHESSADRKRCCSERNNLRCSQAPNGRLCLAQRIAQYDRIARDTDRSLKKKFCRSNRHARGGTRPAV
jgi:hypothetical protein